jgi:acetyl esterase/lipase
MRPTEVSYGDDPAQRGELYRPVGPTLGTVVVIHGGFWRAAYDLALGRPLAQDLVARGYAVWNLEYRRVGNGGGWPTTFTDVAAGIDVLADLDVDATRVVAVGHSAGGQLAVWAAGRSGLPAGALGADPRIRLDAAVSQAGVLDLIGADRLALSASAVVGLLGGSADIVPDRYALADPLTRVPLPVPVLCLHSQRDRNVPFAQSVDYVTAARAAGADAVLQETSGDHMSLIDPSSPDWALVIQALPALLAG